MDLIVSVLMVTFIVKINIIVRSSIGAATIEGAMGAAILLG